MTFWPRQILSADVFARAEAKDWSTIVGVVDDVKNAGLDRPAGTELYLPYRQPAGAGNSDMYVVSEDASGDPRSLGRRCA